jgi:peptide/nickel transport system permease protein
LLDPSLALGDLSGTEPLEEQAGTPARREAFRRFAAHRLAVTGLVFLSLIVLMAIFAPLIAPDGPVQIDLTAINQPPSLHHLFGTDSLGRDLWARVVYGARVSLVVGFGAVAISLAIGTALGLVAGVFGGWIDGLLMRITDAFLSIPAILLVMVFVAVVGPSLSSIVVSIALIQWTTSARLVRGQVLGLREREFVLAAYVTGVSRRRVVLDHLMPNLLGPLSVLATFSVANAILIEAGLSFLGLGVRPPTPSWGQIISAAQEPSVLLTQWWIWVPACVAISLTVLSINFIGDGLRDALDPKSRR